MSNVFWWLNPVRLFSLYKIVYPKRRIESYSILGTKYAQIKYYSSEVPRAQPEVSGVAAEEVTPGLICKEMNGLGFRGLGFRGLGFRGLGFRGLRFRV